MGRRGACERRGACVYVSLCLSMSLCLYISVCVRTHTAGGFAVQGRSSRACRPREKLALPTPKQTLTPKPSTLKQLEGLASVCKRVLGVTVNKEHQCSNWDRRPLLPSQVSKRDPVGSKRDLVKMCMDKAHECSQWDRVGLWSIYTHTERDLVKET